MQDVVIIGGGAAGMACAITAAQRGLRVTLLEQMDRVGKKILATGNGRCNLMNTGKPCYPGGTEFAKTVLAACDVQQQCAFWQALGLRVREEDGGRVYPVSGQATSVLDALRLGMALYGVKIETGVKAREIIRDKGCLSVVCEEGRYKARNVLVAGGGKAQPKLGSDGSAYALLQGLGHTITPTHPVLTQIMTDTRPIAGLSGIRVKAAVRVKFGGSVLHEEQGEALFTDYGISGVCAMQCARYARKSAVLSLDLLAGMGFNDAHEAAGELLRRSREWGNQPMEQLLCGLCVPRVASALCKAAGITWKDRSLSDLTKREATALAGIMGNFEVQISGVKGFEQAQVTRGGADVREFNPDTMESRLVPGVYAAGEVLDVDGDCGGYNLMFAFASGIIAGRNMEE